jgi:predicted ABC-type ATPase
MNQKQPQVIMVAGANGSGKTSAAMTLLPNLDCLNFINADEIAKGLSPLNPEIAAVDAGRLMLQRLNKTIHTQQSFSFETTGAGLIHIRTLQKCRKAGYYIRILYLYLSSVEIAIERVANRVLQGGHNVPINDIKRRYNKGLKRLLIDYTPLANEVKIVDNSYGLMRTIALKTLRTCIHKSYRLQII